MNFIPRFLGTSWKTGNHRHLFLSIIRVKSWPTINPNFGKNKSTMYKDTPGKNTPYFMHAIEIISYYGQ